jgi:tetratricopeptide (TPR) repeat protein
MPLFCQSSKALLLVGVFGFTAFFLVKIWGAARRGSALMYSPATLTFRGSSMKHVLLAFTALASLSLTGSVFAAGGGGGGSMMPSEMPSVSAPRYDAAKEYQKGTDALNANDFKAANTAFNHVLEVAPRDLNTLILAAFTKSKLEDFKGARDTYKKAIAVDKNNIKATEGLAIAYYALGDKDNGAKTYDTLKQRATACADTCAEAAQLKSSLTAIETAANAPGKQSFLERPALLLGDAKAADSAYVTAVAEINEARYTDALVSLAKTQDVLGPHPDVLTYIGYTYRKMGQYDKAENYYQQALTIAPNHIGATEYYGELKVERGDIKGAKEMLAKLDKLCAFGCVEAEDLRRWIAQGHG